MKKLNYKSTDTEDLRFSSPKLLLAGKRKLKKTSQKYFKNIL